MQLQSIISYPIKSINGISLREAVVFEHGLHFDRNWMLVNAKDEFITRRSYPQLAQIRISESESHFQLIVNGHELLISKQSTDTETDIHSHVWDTPVVVKSASQEASQFFSDFLNEDVRLVHLPLPTQRLEKNKQTGQGIPSSLADSFPLLICGTASLQALNERLDYPASMDYFRPNLVIETITPFEEDSWNVLQVGDVMFEGVKKCGRCSMINVNPQTGEVRSDVMRGLASFRKDGNGVYFGKLFRPVRSSGNINLTSPILVAS
jgi:uncharacterized protein